MIRIATPSIANDIQESKPLSFGRMRHGMIGPAAGIVYYAPVRVEAAAEPTASEVADAEVTG
jgi:hypothetical protein